MDDDTQQPWNTLLGELLDGRDALAERVRRTIQSRISAYRGVAAEDLDAEIGFQIERVLRSALVRTTGATDGERAELARIGETRAQQGVPVDDMLRAWRVGVEVVVAVARDTGRRLGTADALVLEFVQAALAWSDRAMVTTAEAHRQAGRTLVLADGARREDFVRGALFGTVPVAELRIQAEAYGLDPTAAYVAVRSGLGAELSRQRLEAMLGFCADGQFRRGLSALVDGCLVGFLTAAPDENIDATVGLGPARPLERLSESYRLAARALMTMQACRFTGARDVCGLGLRAAVAVDTDVGESLRRRYLEPLADGGSARELTTTLRAYLACDMHVERTATRLFVHQNTVRYRLARFEELTGASLRDTEVLFGVWWALEAAAMDL